MNKVLLVFLTLSVLTGCASAPSQYNQGCRDGVAGVTSREDKDISKYCDGLDNLRRNEQNMRDGSNRPGRM